MERRQFLIEGAKWAAFTAGVTPFLAACREVARSAQPTPELSPEQQWRQASPSDRLQRLEMKRFPQFNGFSLVPELSLAAAQLRTQVTHNTRTIDEMVQAVNVLPHDAFAKVFTEHGQPAPLPNHITIEFVDPSLKVIYLDRDGIRTYASRELSQATKDSLARYSRDPELVLLKEVIIHAQSHMNQSQEQLTLDNPVEVQLPNTDQKIKVLKMDGLFIHMQDPNGEFRSLSGISETLTQIATRVLCGKAGAYISFAPYKYGEDLIDPLLKLGMVNEEDLLKVYHQQSPQSDLLDKLGSIPRGQNALEGRSTSQRDMGIKVLTIIGLTVNGVIPPQMAPSWIERMYGTKIY
jgi:hypothetical protein